MEDKYKKIAVRLNLDINTVKMLEELSRKNANSSKSQAARRAIENEYKREFNQQ